jgi:hypothetical protein
MSFKVVPNRTFTHDITVTTPVDGGFEEESLKVTFNVIETTEYPEYDLNTAEGTRAFLLRVINKLDDLTDENKKPILYNDAVRDHLLGLPWVLQPLCSGYFAGVTQAKAGN